MLSRTAASLYWLARYLERAENTARLLEVTHTLSLMPVSADPSAELASALEISGATSLYHELNKSSVEDGKMSVQSVLNFFVFEPRNPGSIRSCLKLARDNAHAVRGSITSEVWESVNATWLEMSLMSPEAMEEMGADVFFDYIKERSHVFRGAAFGTMMRNDAFRFMRVGTLVERANNTARMLDFKYARADTTDTDSAVLSAADYYQWNALLRALGAFEAYQSQFYNRICAEHVAELLILNPVVPRSLAACLREVAEILPDIEGDSGRAAKRLASEMAAALCWGEISAILAVGVHAWLDDFVDHIHHLGDAIHVGYLEVA